jgi:hypothetical protein
MGMINLIRRLRDWCRDASVDETLNAADITSPIEQIIRDEFEHFEAVNLTGDQNWRMRLKTGRLCEIIVVYVKQEIHEHHDFARSEGSD